jgi:hypothetical protein
MLSLVHVLEWRAAVQPGLVQVPYRRHGRQRTAAQRDGRAALREPFWAGRDRRVS